MLVGDGANPIICGNSVHDGRSLGVQFSGLETKGRFERNNVERNAGAGLEVCDGASPTVTLNLFHDGQDAGVLIDDATVLITHNKIYGNSAANVVFRGASTSGRLTFNAVYGGSQHGVYIEDGASPLVDSNMIYANKEVAWGGVAFS